MFLTAQWNFQRLLGAASIYDRWNAEIKIPDGVLSCQEIGYRQDGVFVPDNTFCNMTDCHSDSIISRSFAVNNIIGAVFDSVIDCLHCFCVMIVPAKFTEIMDGDSSNIGTAPYCKFTIAVFPDDKRMDAFCINLKMLA